MMISPSFNFTFACNVFFLGLGLGGSSRGKSVWDDNDDDDAVAATSAADDDNE